MEQSRWGLSSIGEFMNIMSKEEKVAGAYAYLSNDNQNSFWYMYKSYNHHHLAISHNSDNKATSYNEINVDGLKKPLSYPKGIIDDQYYHVVYRSDLDMSYLTSLRVSLLVYLQYIDPVKIKKLLSYLLIS